MIDPLEIIIRYNDDYSIRLGNVHFSEEEQDENGNVPVTCDWDVIEVDTMKPIVVPEHIVPRIEKKVEEFITAALEDAGASGIGFE